MGYRDAYKDIVNFRNATMSPQEQAERMQALHKSVRQMDKDVHAEIAQWKEHVDEQGNRFYFNREKGQSTWTDPRIAQCQVLCLRMKILNVLFLANRSHAGSGERDAESASWIALQTEDPALTQSKVGVASVSEVRGGSVTNQEAETILDANRMTS